MGVMYEILLMLTAAVLIATTSIAIQSYNNNTGYKGGHKTSFKFLVITLVLAILSMLASFAGIYMGLKSKGPS